MKGKPAFIIRQGSAQVVVYKSAKGNRFCLCYRKHVGAARSRETRTGEKAARARALEIATALANGRTQVLELGATDRDGYLYAKSLLPAGVPLHVAIEEWVAARSLLGPTVGLLEVVRDWKRRHLGEHCEYFQYTSVPAPRIKANNRGEGLPSVPGIYFVWEGLRCVYVGRSANLSLRCVLGKHPALKPGDVLSWIEEPVVRLKVAEAFISARSDQSAISGRRRWASSSHETAAPAQRPENSQVRQRFVQSLFGEGVTKACSRQR